MISDMITGKEVPELDTKQIKRQNESFKKKNDEAEKSKANTLDPTDKKFHQPNRPSI